MKLPIQNELKYFFNTSINPDNTQKIPLRQKITIVFLVEIVALLYLASCQSYREKEPFPVDEFSKIHDNFTQMNQQMESMHRLKK